MYTLFLSCIENIVDALTKAKQQQQENIKIY